jgi:(E)-4-hydroxy-3-methylbut-2-enyl-diphosphate synthase
MPCIVNGSGENWRMQTLGYVGTVLCRVRWTCTTEKEIVRKSVPKNEESVDALIDLIKEYGMWKEKEVEEADEAAVVAWITTFTNYL